MTGRILVTGGTGTVGSHVVDMLAARSDAQIRVLTRIPAAALPAGVELVVGDFSDPSSVQASMEGCTALFLLSSGIDLPTHDAIAARAAGEAGVGRIVKVSVLGVSHDAHDSITTWHRAGEAAVRATGIPSTMLRPTGFMTNALNWVWSIASSGTVAAPYPDGRAALIDPVDIADVATHALLSPDEESRVYDLTGPQALSPGEQVAVLSQELGRELRYEPEDPAATRSTLERYGMTADLAEAILALFASAAEPWNAAPTPTVQEVTGRPATDFRTWVQRNRNSFTTPPTW